MYFACARDLQCCSQRLNGSCLSSKMTLQKFLSSHYLHASSIEEVQTILNLGWPGDIL